jgi:energy-coupling factor transporter transmembrane protein EcfT
MALSGFALLHMNVRSLGVFSFLLACGIPMARLPWRAILLELKTWWLFLAAVFLVQAWATGGTRLESVPWLPTGPVELKLAALSCWRLALILCYAAFFTAVTRPRELQDALLWLLKPFPFLPARRIALMATLTMRFLPLVLDEADEVRAAGRARLGQKRRNPLLRMKHFALPVFKRSLLRADELALALAARGYREDLPLVLPGIPGAHLAVLGAFAVVVLVGIDSLLPASSLTWF